MDASVNTGLWIAAMVFTVMLLVGMMMVLVGMARMDNKTKIRGGLVAALGGTPLAIAGLVWVLSRVSGKLTTTEWLLMAIAFSLASIAATLGSRMVKRR